MYHNYYKHYYGSASKFQNGKLNRFEGTMKLISCDVDKTLLNGMKNIEESFQSAISYGGGKELKDLKSVDFIVK